MQGHVVRLRADRGFGFIREGDPSLSHRGLREWFFHRKDCDPMTLFAQLQEGDAVIFEPGIETEKGPRAHGVQRG